MGSDCEYKICNNDNKNQMKRKIMKLYIKNNINNYNYGKKRKYILLLIILIIKIRKLKIS